MSTVPDYVPGDEGPAAESPDLITSVKCSRCGKIPQHQRIYLCELGHVTCSSCCAVIISARSPKRSEESDFEYGWRLRGDCACGQCGGLTRLSKYILLPEQIQPFNNDGEHLQYVQLHSNRQSLNTNKRIPRSLLTTIGTPKNKIKSYLSGPKVLSENCVYSGVSSKTSSNSAPCCRDSSFEPVSSASSDFSDRSYRTAFKHTRMLEWPYAHHYEGTLQSDYADLPRVEQRRLKQVRESSCHRDETAITTTDTLTGLKAQLLEEEQRLSQFMLQKKLSCNEEITTLFQCHRMQTSTETEMKVYSDNDVAPRQTDSSEVVAVAKLTGEIPVARDTAKLRVTVSYYDKLFAADDSPIRYLETTHRPIVCPNTECARILSPFNLAKHIAFAHQAVPRLPVEDGIPLHLWLEANQVPVDQATCVMLLLLGGRARGNGEQRLALPVMVARLRTSNESREVVLLWLTDMDSSSVVYTAGITDRTLRSKLFLYRLPAYPLRMSQKPNDVYEQGDCIVVKSSTVNELCKQNGGLDVFLLIHSMQQSDSKFL